VTSPQVLSDGVSAGHVPVPFAHLSIEVGRLAADDLALGLDHVRRHFQSVAGWAEAARRKHIADIGGRPPRISTCFLIDDYSARYASPAALIPELLGAAQDSGLAIDYLARQSSCATTDTVPVARLTEERIVPDPPPGSNGSRPPVTEVGWLCNGQRSPAAGQAEAMGALMPWAPASENGADGQSVFVDIQLWEEHGTRITWSDTFLCAVWQLLRLGMLRSSGQPVAAPQVWQGALPDDWDALPAIIQMNPTAAPFCAYRTLSVLPTGLVRTAHAVRVILSQVAMEGAAVRYVDERSRAESYPLPAALIDRLEYILAS
jgi:hypothetical protein